MNKIEQIKDDYVLAVEYFNHTFELGYQLEKVELSTQSAKINYDSFVNTLMSTNPRTLTFYHKSDFKTVTGTALGTMRDIFGYSIPMEEYVNLLYMCGISKGPDPFECNYVEVNGQKILLFDRLDTLDSIPCVAHEATHYLQDKYTNLRNGFHCEVLSMLIELIVLDDIDSLHIDSNLKYKNYAKTINALKNLQNLISGLKEYEEYQESLKPQITAIKEHRENLAYTYTASYIYAYNLYLKYKENPDELITEIRKVFISETSVDKIIEHYNLTFDNTSTFEAPNKLLNQFKR